MNSQKAATTSLGDFIDEYLGVSIADYGAAVGQPIIRGMSGSESKNSKKWNGKQRCFWSWESII